MRSQGLLFLLPLSSGLLYLHHRRTCAEVGTDDAETETAGLTVSVDDVGVVEPV